MADTVDFSFVWLAVGALVLLGVVSQLVWWTRRSYFPNQEFCEGAHNRFHLSKAEKRRLGEVAATRTQSGDVADGIVAPEPKRSPNYEEAKREAEKRFWHNIAWGMLSHAEGITTRGFFCTLIWPVFVVLNVLLLAQVIGVIFSGGRVFDLNWVGTYRVIPLISAVLYAVAQSVFGIMFGEADSKDKKRYLLLAMLVLAIVLEGGLAVYRAWLIRGGGATAAANLIDSSLAGKFGLVVGAFFGIFFPATHAALGYVGFPQFVAPFFRYLFRLAGGIVLLALAVGNFCLLAWHPVHPTDWLEGEPERLAAAVEKKKKKEEAAKAKREEADARKKPGTNPGDGSGGGKPSVTLPGTETPEHQHAVQQVEATQIAKSLADDLGALLGRLPLDVADVKSSFAEAAALRAHWSEVAGNAKQLVAAASRLDAEKIAALAANISSGSSGTEAPLVAGQTGVNGARPVKVDPEEERRQAILESAIVQGKTRLGPLFKVANSYDNLQSAIDAIAGLEHKIYWKEAKTTGQKILDDVARHQKALPQLENRLKALSKFAKPGLDPATLLRQCKVRLDNLKDRFSAIPAPDATNFIRYSSYKDLEPLVDQCEVLFDELKKKIESAKVVPSLPSVESLDGLKSELDAIPEQLSSAYMTALRSLGEAKRAAIDKQKRVEGRPGWYYRLGDLVA